MQKSKIYPPIIIMCISLVFVIQAEAAKCKVNGEWYDYSDPRCTGHKAIPENTNPEELQNRSAAEHSVVVERLYECSTKHNCVIIRSDKQHRVKCILYDRNNRPLQVKKKDT